MTRRELGALARYASGLRRFLREPLTRDEARALVTAGLEARGENFLRLLDSAVFRRKRSPYSALFRLAGIEAGDVARLVRDDGVEAALGRLYDAGVYVGLDEFKGRRPIVRPGLELEVDPGDFDLPLPGRAMPGRTGGSRGPARRVLVDLDHRLHQAAYHSLTMEAFALDGRPLAVWRAAPPAFAGIGAVVTHAKLGIVFDRWFSQTRLTPRGGLAREYLFTVATLLAGRTTGRRLPFPRHVPVGEAQPVARWLAEKKAEGPPAYVSTTASSGVRACLAALESGLDIEGTFFRLGGEPFTPAKARVFERAGCVAVGNYSLTEAGRVGIPCADPAALDDYHIATDKLALIRRDRPIGRDGSSVGAFMLTTVGPSCPKLMINVDTGDYGTLVERDCRCPLGLLGLRLHAVGVRSYEKLTSEGMTFTGVDLGDLVDEVLPRRFGGHPTDYQLVEEEVDGLPRISVVASPRIGALDDAAVIETVIECLRDGERVHRMMADVWRVAETLRVVRREPHETPGAKVLPLHVLEEPVQHERL